jgi:TolA-binding protein
MAWATGDREKIRRYLNIVASVPEIDQLKSNMAATAEDQITTAQAAIKELDDLYERLNAQLDEDQGVRRADVIEFDLNRRNAGLDRRIGYQKRILAEAIAWPYWQGDGPAMLLRS